MMTPRPPCGDCRWLCRICGETWTCVAEGYCRVAPLTMCRPCWAIKAPSIISL